MGPRAGLEKCGKSRPHRDSISGPSSPQPVAIPTALSRPQSYDCALLCLAGTVSAITGKFWCDFRNKQESFLILKPSSPAVVSGSILAGQKRPECEAHYWPLSRSHVNKLIHISTPHVPSEWGAKLNTWTLPFTRCSSYVRK